MIRLRRAASGSSEDVKTYLGLQEKAWGLDMAVSAGRAEGRLDQCANTILFAEDNGIVIGTTTMIRLLNYDFDNPMSWNDATGNGTCDTHDPEGDVCFGVDLSAGEHMDAVDLLLVGCMQLVIESGVKYCVLGGRIPGFARYLEERPHLDPKSRDVAEEYLRDKPDGRYRDWQVRMYNKIPGLNLVSLIPDYFDDPASLDYGVLWRWRNPFFGLPGSAISRRLPILGYQMWQAARSPTQIDRAAFLLR